MGELTRDGTAESFLYPPNNEVFSRIWPFATPINAEGLPNLPPKIERGGRSAVSYLTYSQKKKHGREGGKMIFNSALSP